MTSCHAATRDRYQPSGKVNWGRFLFWSPTVFAASLLMAFCMSEAFNRGFQGFHILVLAMMLVAGIVHLVIGLSHCRNRLLGGVIGFVAGLLLYLGYFHVNMVSAFGLQVAHRVDLLPDFIAHRMATDVIVRSLKDDPDANATRNGMLFAFQGLFVVATLAGVAGYRAGRVYCEACHRWATRERGHTDVEHGVAIAQALEAGTLESLPAMSVTREKPPTHHSHTQIDLEHCPGRGEGQCSLERHLTVTIFKTCYWRTPLKQVKLDRDEFVTLATKGSLPWAFA